MRDATNTLIQGLAADSALSGHRSYHIAKNKTEDTWLVISEDADSGRVTAIHTSKSYEIASKVLDALVKFQEAFT